jgi:hypothetical protein
MVGPSVPYPLFPPLGLLNEHAHAELPINLEVRRRLEAVPEHLDALRAWRTGIEFLMKESRRPEFREWHYKVLCPIVESMMHWSWSIRGKALCGWQSVDARAFMEFIVRPPITWVATPGCSRYSKKTRQNFPDKFLDPKWRPIIRKTISGNDPGLSSKHHRNWFITHGREYFAFIASASGTETENPFRDISSKDFDARPEKSRAIFTSLQLSDLIRIAESLANYSEKLEPLLFAVAVAIHSDIPLRALGATQTIKPTFSYFKARNPEASDAVPSRAKTNCANIYLASRPRLSKGPGLFESPVYPGRQFVLAPQFEPYFRRYAQFRYLHDRSLGSHSFVIALGHGLDAYAYGSLIENLSEFTARILEALRAKPASARKHWKGSDKLDLNASLTFGELRESAKRAGLTPKAFVSQDVGRDADVWPDIGIRLRNGFSRTGRTDS